MLNSDLNTGDLLSKLGLEVSVGDIEVGKRYPIFGMITDFVNDELGNVIVEINFNIRARLQLLNENWIDFLKERAFETGIFVCTVLATSPRTEVECETVIFGKKQSFSA